MKPEQYAERKSNLAASNSSATLAIILSFFAWLGGNFWVICLAAFFWLLFAGCLYLALRKEPEEPKD